MVKSPIGTSRILTIYGKDTIAGIETRIRGHRRTNVRLGDKRYLFASSETAVSHHGYRSFLVDLVVEHRKQIFVDMSEKLTSNGVFISEMHQQWSFTSRTQSIFTDWRSCSNSNWMLWDMNWVDDVRWCVLFRRDLRHTVTIQSSKEPHLTSSMSESETRNHLPIEVDPMDRWHWCTTRNCLEHNNSYSWRSILVPVELRWCRMHRVEYCHVCQWVDPVGSSSPPKLRTTTRYSQIEHSALDTCCTALDNREHRILGSTREGDLPASWLPTAE